MTTATRLGLRLAMAGLALLGFLASSAQSATVTIINVDGPNEGFNDPTPAAPVGGNPGTTLGAQRLFVFQYAANLWGGLLTSSVPILVNAKMDVQTCDASGAVLASTSAGSSHRNFANAPFPDTWYQQALANKLAHVDLNPGVNDMNVTFNSNLEAVPPCPFRWYYGVDGNEGTDPLVIELLPVVLHELGHGLGFATITLAGVQMGTPPGPHVYDRFLFDDTQGQHWNQMATDAQRAASAVNCQKLTWDGPSVALAAPSRLGPKPILRVNSPAAIAGDYEVGLPQFGPALASPGVTGNLVLVNDGMGVPTNGCEAYLNAAAIAGNIALIDRGGCTFVSKIARAQAAGAIAVVVADSTPGCPPAGMAGIDPTITIPSVRITQSDGVLIKNQLLSGVNVTLRIDPTLKAGADAAGRPLVYTPTQFATGSSVSHWDTSAEPSLLMEPFATAGLSSDVDLTIPHFVDIGWFNDPTATTLAFFTAQGRTDGILLRWQFADPAQVAAITVERADVTSGPWSPIPAATGSEGTVTTALDGNAESGRDYYYRLQVMDPTGHTETMGLTSGRRAAVTAGLFLGAPTPNPTANGSSILFRIARPEYVRLAVVDVNGRRLRTLHEGMMSPGEYTRVWDGRSDRSGAVSPGMYFVTLSTSEGVKMQRVAVTR